MIYPRNIQTLNCRLSTVFKGQTKHRKSNLWWNDNLRAIYIREPRNIGGAQVFTSELRLPIFSFSTNSLPCLKGQLTVRFPGCVGEF